MIAGGALVTAIALIFLSPADALLIGATVIGGAVVVTYQRGRREGRWDWASGTVPTWLAALGALGVLEWVGAWVATDAAGSNTRDMLMTWASIGLLALLVHRGAPSTPEERWASRRGLELGPDGSKILRTYLRRRFAISCAGAALLGAWLIFLAVTDFRVGDLWIIALIPWAVTQVQIIATELTHKAPRDSSRPAAIVATRTMEQHVSRDLTRLTRAIGLVALALPLAYAALARGKDVDPTPGRLMVVGALTFFVTAACEIALRLRVRVAQPYVSDELLALDEAIRKEWTNRALTGGLCLPAMALGYETWCFGALAATEWTTSVLHGAGIVVGGALYLYGLVRLPWR